MLSVSDGIGNIHLSYYPGNYRDDSDYRTPVEAEPQEAAEIEARRHVQLVRPLHLDEKVSSDTRPGYTTASFIPYCSSDQIRSVFHRVAEHRNRFWALKDDEDSVEEESEPDLPRRRAVPFSGKVSSKVRMHKLANTI